MQLVSKLVKDYVSHNHFIGFYEKSKESHDYTMESYMLG